MSHKIVVLIRDDPFESHRPVEAFRIALGLSTGSTPLTIMLLNKACILLTEDAPDVIAGEILEKHIPVVQELKIPIVIPEGSRQRYAIDPGFDCRDSSNAEMASLLAEADRVIAF